MAEVAIGRSGLHLLVIAARVCKCVYINFNRIGAVTGCISLPYCYCMSIVTEHFCLFIDYTCIEIVTEHMS